MEGRSPVHGAPGKEREREGERGREREREGERERGREEETEDPRTKQVRDLKQNRCLPLGKGPALRAGQRGAYSDV